MTINQSDYEFATLFYYMKGVVMGIAFQMGLDLNKLSITFDDGKADIKIEGVSKEENIELQAAWHRIMERFAEIRAKKGEML